MKILRKASQVDILAALNAAPEPPARPADAPAKARDGREAEKTAFSREFDGVSNKEAEKTDKAAGEPARDSRTLHASRTESASDVQRFPADRDAADAAGLTEKRLEALSAEFKAALSKVKGGKAAESAADVKTADSDKKESSEPKEEKPPLADKAAAASAIAKSRLTVAEARRLLAENATFTFDQNGRLVLSHRALENPAVKLVQAAKEAAAKEAAAKSAGKTDAKDDADPAQAKHHDKKKDAAAAIADALAQASVLPAAAKIQKDAPADGDLSSSRLVDALLDSKRSALAGDIQLKSALHRQGDPAKTPLAAILAAAQPAKPDAGQLPPDIAAALNAIGNHNAANAQTAAAQQNPTPPQTAAAAQSPANQVIAAIHAGHGRGDIHVRLDPPDLGSVRIHFSLDRADGVTATVTSDRGDTLNLMRRHGDDLVRELQRAGFARVQLDFSSSNNSNGFTSQRQAAGSAGAAASFTAEAADDARIVQFIRRGDMQLDRLV